MNSTEQPAVTSKGRLFFCATLSPSFPLLPSVQKSASSAFIRGQFPPAPTPASRPLTSDL
jgi:hypothetical protein